LVIEVSHELMMRKGGKPKLIGHHKRTRPPSATRHQAIKVPKGCIAERPEGGEISSGLAVGRVHLRCGKAARFAVPERWRLRLFPRQSARLSMVSIKAAPFARNIPKESRSLPATLAIAQALASQRLLPCEQRQNCP
jgi:hypothetical protein